MKVRALQNDYKRMVFPSRDSAGVLGNNRRLTVLCIVIVSPRPVNASGVLSHYEWLLGISPQKSKSELGQYLERSSINIILGSLSEYDPCVFTRFSFKKKKNHILQFLNYSKVSVLLLMNLYPGLVWVLPNRYSIHSYAAADRKNKQKKNNWIGKVGRERRIF